MARCEPLGCQFRVVGRHPAVPDVFDQIVATDNLNSHRDHRTKAIVPRTIQMPFSNRGHARKQLGTSSPGEPPQVVRRES